MLRPFTCLLALFFAFELYGARDGAGIPASGSDDLRSSQHTAPATTANGDLPRERIIYTTHRPAGWQIFLTQPETAPRQLTDDPELSYDGAFSPDGRWAVYCSERSGTPHLYALDLTKPGSPKQLTSGEFQESAPAFTPDGKWLLFVSDRAGNSDIFVMPFRPDDPAAGDNAENLTRSPAGEFRPAVSPDGRSIAFSSDRDLATEYTGWTEIYVMNRDGSNPRRLTTSHAMSGSPVWSPDGRAIYFYTQPAEGNSRIWTMDADGANQRPLTPNELSALSPAVMPDGRVAFSAKSGDGFKIMSMAADGTDVRLERGAPDDCRTPGFHLPTGRMVCVGKGMHPRPPSFNTAGTHTVVRLPDRVLDVQGVHNLFCSISPDGGEILTANPLATDDWNATELVINRLDGSGQRVIFRSPSARPVWATSWAKRGDLIAFTIGKEFAKNDEVLDIWTVHSDGSKATNLTRGMFLNNSFPDVRPDGSEIVFRSTRDGNKEIYLMNSDGTNVRKISSTTPVNTMPAISPAGDLIAYSGSGYQIYLQPLANGKPDGPPRLFQKHRPSVHSRFSPDGKWIVFASSGKLPDNEDDSFRTWLNDEVPLVEGIQLYFGEIYVASVDGKYGPIRLTHNKWADSLPCWGVVPESR